MKHSLLGFIGALMALVAYVTFTGGETIASALALAVLALTVRETLPKKVNPK